MSKVSPNWGLILLSYVSLLMLGFLDNMRGPFLSFVIQDLKLTDVQSGFFFGTTSCLAFFASLASKRFLQWWGSQTLMIITLLGAACGFGAIATVDSFMWMVVACGFFGINFGALNVAQNVAIQEACPAHHQRRVFSGLHSMYGLAALLAPAGSALWIHAQGGEWRRAFAWAALLPFLAALTGLIFRRRIRGAPDLGKRSSTPATPARDEYRVRHWHFLLMAVMMSLYMFGELSVSSRLALWLTRDRFFPPDEAAWWVAGFCGLLLAGRVFLTFFPIQQWSESRVLFLSALSAGVSYALGLTVHPLGVVISGLFMSPFFPVAMELITKRAGAHSAQAVGLALGIGSASIMGMHLLLGWLTKLWGLSQALWIGPIGLLSLTGVIYLERRWASRWAEPEPQKPRSAALHT